MTMLRTSQGKAILYRNEELDALIEEDNEGITISKSQQVDSQQDDGLYDLNAEHSGAGQRLRRRSSADILISHAENNTFLKPTNGADLQIAGVKKCASIPSVALHRRGSLDVFHEPRKFLIDVEETQRRILVQEDTDGDLKITVNDKGPKVFTLGTVGSDGQRKIEVRGTYMLSNLLQELSLARDIGLKQITIDESRLSENPVSRISRMIRDYFWDGLLRRIDHEGMPMITKDPKTRGSDGILRAYVPWGDKEAYDYFSEVARYYSNEFALEIVQLPEVITINYLQSLNAKPGILALKLYDELITHKDGTTELRKRGAPFVVPGGRFNEMYGWDSYFEALGLLCDHRLSVAKSMVENFVYEIENYGKILNANRTYYLLRSQPPFLTDMALQVYRCMKSNAANEEEEEDKPANIAWLRLAIIAAMKEYRNVWMSTPRYVPEIGLSRYFSEGRGIPPETEISHFDTIIEPFSLKMGMTVKEYAMKYNSGDILEPELDEYFMHDRAVRESGHDTTYRFEWKCAHLCTIDLNSLLYKYETDIAFCIDNYFSGCLTWSDTSKSGAEIRHENANEWRARAIKRQELMNRYLWNEREGMYFDYNFKEKRQMEYETATTLFPLWAKLATVDQAKRLVEEALPRFEMAGGLVSGTQRSRGPISLSRPNRQWDYPYGWAPHQILAWQGMVNYGYTELAQRLAYKWLNIIVRSVVDFNGTVPEKYDVVACTHRVFAEYGNVGTDFSYITKEGFGWMNASFQVGLHYLTSHQKRALGTMTPTDILFENSYNDRVTTLTEGHISSNSVNSDSSSHPSDISLFPSNAAMTLLQAESPPAPVSVERRSSFSTYALEKRSILRGSTMNLIAERQIYLKQKGLLKNNNGSNQGGYNVHAELPLRPLDAVIDVPSKMDIFETSSDTSPTRRRSTNSNNQCFGDEDETDDGV